MFDVVTERLFGDERVVRSLPNNSRHIYLTFDDGPDPEFTPLILDVLEEFSASATFFVVAQQAQVHAHVVRQIVESGHALGNHSYDHDHRTFFLRNTRMREWIQRGEDILRQIAKCDSVGFRPPNGVITPDLLRATSAMNMSVYLWNCRFFDTLTSWKKTTALKALSRLQSGDILLLHDRQKKKHHPEFLETLREFLREGQAAGWVFASLPKRRESR